MQDKFTLSRCRGQIQIFITLWYTKLGKSLNFNDDVLSIWNCIGNMDSDITQHHCLEPGDREISAELLYGCWIWILFTRKSFAHMIRGHPHITSPPFWYFLTPPPACHQFYIVKLGISFSSVIILKTPPLPLGGDVIFRWSL